MSDKYNAPEDSLDSSSRIRNETLFSECQKISDIFSRIGDKWSAYALLLLGNGPMRFGELKAKIDGISQRMLTLTLRGLERDGLVTRTVFAIVPPKVEYELTPIALSLIEVLSHLGNWAIEHHQSVVDSRTQYDQRSKITRQM
ncbi:winged helix-turn-helix transcriptional regulator [Burkholderia cenocepacia]|uniref:winged helix-turn-helix transcriptional regulator n=1 Tax=Burkholderia cenocepacia TaxID=95486 RepID=UPI0009B53451|nr:helix-turn-helix domain-containing protein [Burkholderia cenocepacia]